MLRRDYLAGTAVGLTILAGCTSGGSPEGSGETTTTTQQTSEPSESSNGGQGLTATVEPSASFVAYGETYDVTVTLMNDSDESGMFMGRFVARSPGGPWEPLGQTSGVHLGPGQSETASYQIVPPGVGTIEFGLMDAQTMDLLAQWALDVDQPSVPFGEPIDYYDGLRVTAEVSFAEEIPMEVENLESMTTVGVRPIKAPVGEQWGIVDLTLENTSDTDPAVMATLRDRDFTLLADGVQQERHRAVGWSHSKFEAQFNEYEEVNVLEEPDHYDPPAELVPGAKTEGWLLFTAPAEADDQTLQLVLVREVLALWDPIRATWGAV